MSFDKRLGIAGLFVACFGIAAFYIWPNEKWIGWTFLGIAIALGAIWLYAEVVLKFGSDAVFPTFELLICFCAVCWLTLTVFNRNYLNKPIAPTASQPDTLPPNPANFTFSSDRPLLRGLHANRKMMSLDVDTSVLELAAKNFHLIVVLRVQDDSVDALTDPRILKSSTFTITGEVRTVLIDLPGTFVKRAEEIGGKVGQINIQVYIGVIPKRIQPEQILTITDITALGGKQLMVGSPTAQN